MPAPRRTPSVSCALTDLPRWHAADDGILRDVLGDYRTRRDDSALTDRDTVQDDAVRADPHVVTNHDAARRHALFPDRNIPPREHMVCRGDNRRGGDSHIVADGDSAFAEQHAEWVNGAVRSDL